MPRHLHALAPAALLAAPLIAQATWTPSAATLPVPRTEVVSATDQAGALLFGGVNGPSATAFAELWRFDGAQWSLLPTGAAQPSPRSRLAGDFDLIRRRLVIFGGDAQYAGGGALGDTWEYDPATGQWSNPATPVAPSPRIHARMAFDLPTGRMLLFGGATGGTANNETWGWNGLTWNPLLPTQSPPPRQQQSMCYHGRTGEVVMFGGSAGAASGILGDTWIWSAGNWQQVVTATVPGGTGLRNAKMTYDALRDRVVLFGGVSTSGFSDAVWEFDGVDWRQRQPAPGPSTRAGMAVVYVPGLQTTVVAAGYNGGYFADTWTWQTGTPGGATAAGTGCPTSAGVPTLSLAGPPWAGDSMTWLVGQTPPGGLPLLLFGFSATTWNGNPLPLPLDPFGFAGCELRISADGAAVALGPVTTPIPDLPGFYGYTFHNQAAVFEGASLGLSPRLDVTIGAR